MLAHSVIGTGYFPHPPFVTYTLVKTGPQSSGWRLTTRDTWKDACEKGRPIKYILYLMKN